jgi:hypothetical protein
MPSPETPLQAQTWQRMKTLYLRLNLCHACAGQAAWGHQNGFSTIHPPCADCQPIVDELPVWKPGPWKAIKNRGQQPKPLPPTG